MRPSVRGAVAAAVTAGILVLAPGGAGAQVSGEPEVAADGLHNPRGLAFGPDGSLWVAEAGQGGDGACSEGPEGEVCYGESSALTRIGDDGPERVVTGIPSLAREDGSGATGAHDLGAVVPDGYWLAGAAGGIAPFGDVSGYGDVQSLGETVIDLVPSPSGIGYWLLTADGDVFASGAAQSYGSAADLPPLAAPIVAMAATPTGHGYWLVGEDGGVFAFGDAAFRGSAGGTTLVAPVDDIASTASGQGYWLVARDGGVFTYGDAPFLGSAGGVTLSQPVVDIAPTHAGDGYWLFAADGGVFTYGAATFHGSAVGGDHAESAPFVAGATAPITIQFVIGLGADPATRAARPDGHEFATLNAVAGGTWTAITDIGAFEAAEDPDADLGGLVDTNPYSRLAGPNVAWVVDAGGNTVIAVLNGEPFRWAVLPFLSIPDPEGEPGEEISVQPVPNSIAQGPDGALYVGQLTGGPFPEGAASVYRLTPNEDEGLDIEQFATGFTNIIDLAFALDGSLYVLEIDADGLFRDSPAGRLVHVAPGGAQTTVMTDDLTVPGSVVVDDDGAVYVSNCGSCAAGQGEILRWPAAGG